MFHKEFNTRNQTISGLRVIEINILMIRGN
jgi:hypothetical protein